jgi:hypothetical protein
LAAFFTISWDNPLRDVGVKSIDFVCADHGNGVFYAARQG